MPPTLQLPHFAQVTGNFGHFNVFPGVKQDAVSDPEVNDDRSLNQSLQ